MKILEIIAAIVAISLFSACSKKSDIEMKSTPEQKKFSATFAKVILKRVPKNPGLKNENI